MSTDGLRERPTRDLHWIASYPRAVATTLDIMNNELGLPAVQARLVFLPDDATFGALLVEIGYPAAFARDTAEVMTAIGGHRTVLINEGRMHRHVWPRRVSTLAHELTHVLQYELGGGQRGVSSQWLREGFAEYIALRVMEVLGRVTQREVRHEALMRVRAHGPADRIPPFSDLGAFRDWVRHSRGPSGEVLYDVALLAAFAVVERHGMDRVLQYFALFGKRQDRAANFEEAFGESEQGFEQALRRSLWSRR